MRPGPRRHDDDPVAHVDRLVDVVGDQEHRRPAGLPEPQDLVLHPHPGERVERAQRLVEQQDLGVVDQRPGQGRPAGPCRRRAGAGRRWRTPRGRPGGGTRPPRGASRGARRGRRGPAWMLRRTVSQGKRFGSWNTSPRSALGPVIALAADAAARRRSGGRARRSGAGAWTCRSRWGRPARPSRPPRPTARAVQREHLRAVGGAEELADVAMRSDDASSRRPRAVRASCGVRRRFTTGSPPSASPAPGRAP